MDAFFERGLNYWDYAAGGLIAREAGAMVGGLAGQPESTSMTVAAGPELYRQLAALGALCGYEASERFYEIGTPSGLREADVFLRSLGGAK